MKGSSARVEVDVTIEQARSRAKTSTQAWNAVQEELAKRVREAMAADSQLDYRTALQRVFLKDRDLFRRYDEARLEHLNAGAQNRSIELGRIEEELKPLIAAKIAASERKLDAVEARELALRERPDLRRQRIALMRVEVVTGTC